MPWPPSTSTHRGAAIRRLTAVWAGVVALVGVVVAGLWTTGGFSTDVKEFLGPQVSPGQVVETRFWDIAVHRAVVRESIGEVRVDVTAINKQAKTAVDLTYETVEVRLPDGTAMRYSTCTSTRARRFGPLLATDAVCTFNFEGNEVPRGSVPDPGPFDIEFVVLDQEMSHDLLQSSEPRAGQPAAWLPLHVTVMKEDQE